MKKWIVNLGRCLCVVLALGVTMPGWGASSNGCDNDNNDKIVPELALCSTHAYNILTGDSHSGANPSEADRGLMRDVIAMKTTVMTQQMYKQYEYLDAMIRRLKTQLEKAVLSTKLQAAGASAGKDSGDSFKSDDRSVYIAGASNCLNEYQDEQILKCYEKNLTTIVNSSGNGNNPTTEMKKQLANDYKMLAAIKFGNADGCKTDNSSCVPDDSGKVKMTNAQFRTCLNDMRSCLQNQYRSYNNSKQQMNNRNSWN